MRLVHAVCLLLIVLCYADASKRRRSATNSSKKRLASRGTESKSTHVQKGPWKKHTERIWTDHSRKSVTPKSTHSRKKRKKRRKEESFSTRGEPTRTFSDDWVFDASGLNSAEISQHTDSSDLEQTVAKSSDHGPGVHGPGVHGPSVHGPSVHGPSFYSQSAHGPSVYSQSAHGPSVYSQSVHGPSARDPVRKWPVRPTVSILRSTTKKRRLQHGQSAKKVTFSRKVDMIPSAPWETNSLRVRKNNPQ
ncbi:hypothetical protein PSACC_02039 [Paramicrosporidium saccamoebae]|uniref:Secreted protein n=1 Tax=Paramicrosporidium saccamoebae TaxID=1246581 RepID=A0A2H9TK94_9FUNG|nr:hypothetical protein PSACC_02039 [Paramicrosporidium saccamoebae]